MYIILFDQILNDTNNDTKEVPYCYQYHIHLLFNLFNAYKNIPFDLNKFLSSYYLPIHVYRDIISFY